jgi:preprotein translocase subunit SecD
MRYLFAFLLMCLVLPAHADPGRVFAIGGETFAEGDIVDARALPEMNGSIAIMITFSQNAAERVQALTSANLAKPVDVKLDDKVLTSPVVTEPITQGVMSISGSFDLATATALAKKIAGKDPLPDSLDE